eukprot:COSAG01_NODE_1177_length_11372_cov_4.507851_10_plen_52_part_00
MTSVAWIDSSRKQQHARTKGNASGQQCAVCGAGVYQIASFLRSTRFIFFLF